MLVSLPGFEPWTSWPWVQRPNQKANDATSYGLTEAWNVTWQHTVNLINNSLIYIRERGRWRGNSICQVEFVVAKGDLAITFPEPYCYSRSQDQPTSYYRPTRSSNHQHTNTTLLIIIKNWFCRLKIWEEFRFKTPPHPNHVKHADRRFTGAWYTLVCLIIVPRK